MIFGYQVRINGATWRLFPELRERMLSMAKGVLWRNINEAEHIPQGFAMIRDVRPFKIVGANDWGVGPYDTSITTYSYDDMPCPVEEADFVIVNLEQEGSRELRRNRLASST